MNYLYDDLLRDCLNPPKIRNHDVFSPIGLLDLDRLKTSLLNAERFILDDDFVYAAYNLSMSRPSQLLQTLNYARSPYGSLWFECTEAGKLLGGMPKALRSEYAEPIKKVGYLINCDLNDSLRGMIHLFWQLVNPDSRDQFRVSGCIMQYEFNFDLTDDVLDPLNTKSMRALLAEYEDPKEIQASIKLAPRLKMRPSNFLTKESLDALNKDARGDGKVTRQLIRMADDDWGGEGRFIIAVLCLLNSKNLISLESEPERTSDTVNRRRLKAGKLPLYSHKTLKLRFSAKQGYSTGESGSALRRAHLVRGHFKIRKSGLFWWMPHARGDSDLGTIKKDYEVMR
jgi:hypothetical protein